MYGYYILIKGITKLNPFEKETLIELLNDLMVQPDVSIHNDILLAIDVVRSDNDWNVIINNTNSDFYSDLRLYESNHFNTKNQLLTHLQETIDKPIFTKTYINDKTIFYDEVNKHVTENMKKELFKSLYNDKEFLQSIKLYLTYNQNKSKAAKEANLHRNTLENRLDKFYKITGFDVRKFEDAAFVYVFLRNL